MAFTRVTLHWVKGNNQTLMGLLDTVSELTLIPGDPKCHCGPRVRVGTYGGQMISGVFARVYPKLQWALESPCGYFPRSRIHNWNRRTQQLAESPNLNKTFCLILKEPKKLKNETGIFLSTSVYHGVYSILKHF